MLEAHHHHYVLEAKDPKGICLAQYAQTNTQQSPHAQGIFYKSTNNNNITQSFHL